MFSQATVTLFIADGFTVGQVMHVLLEVYPLVLMLWWLIRHLVILQHINQMVHILIIAPLMGIH